MGKKQQEKKLKLVSYQSVILKFLKNYNNKFEEKINFIKKIIQGEKDEIEIIKNVCNYTLNLIYEYDQKYFENDNNEEENNIKNRYFDIKDPINILKVNKYNEFISGNDEIENKIYLDEFELKKRIYINKKNYKDTIIEENDLKKNQNLLKINKAVNKNN